MRQQLLRVGASELSYEIRGIVKKAKALEKAGKSIIWENIGDPIQKHNTVPAWMKDIVVELVQQDASYGYCDSKGVFETREFLAARTNALNGAQVTADDITFFNGLGDAIAKLYQFLLPTSRIILPSPAYSTHSSAEAAHANHHPITYRLDPDNNWYPDLYDLENKIKYNPAIVGIMLINPDNPTGMVYPRQVLEQMVEIARKYDLFLISDEIYNSITYNGVRPVSLAEVIGDTPGIALKGVSKEIPWPGARCGWAEYYNRKQDADFNQLCLTLDNAKMVEVCSTILPQMAIPRILGDNRYPPYRKALNEQLEQRSQWMKQLLGDLPQITFNVSKGAFYNTIIFKDGVLAGDKSMHIANDTHRQIIDQWLQEEPDIAGDKRFVYYMLAAKGVCIVPISSFCSTLQGFRVTLLEEDEASFKATYNLIREGIIEYCGTAAGTTDQHTTNGQVLAMADYK